MASATDILPGHRGVCHRARAFSDPNLAAAAARVERDFAAPYLAQRALLRVIPTVIEFRARPSEEEGRPRWRRRKRLRRYFGEGVAVRIDPVGGSAADAPPWLGQAQADMIVRHRRASEDEWTELHPVAEVEALLRAQAESYLRRFARVASLDR